MQMKGRERAVPSNVRAVSSAQMRIRTRAVPKLVFVAALNAWLLSHSWMDLQTKFLSRGWAGGPAPQIDCQARSSSHNEPSFTSFADHSAQFLDRRIVRLPTRYPPGRPPGSILPYPDEPTGNTRASRQPATQQKAHNQPRNKYPTDALYGQPVRGN